MSDVANADAWAKENMARNAATKMVKWPAKRWGETVRKCVTCGAEFEPTARIQKYCSKECRPSYR